MAGRPLGQPHAGLSYEVGEWPYNLEEINGWFDCHRGEINHLKKREEELEKQEEELKGFVLGGAHEAEVFRNWLDCMEKKVCRCRQTPSEVGEDPPQRRKLGLSCPMLQPEGASMLLLLWKTQFPSL